jgi:hypothetical protein
MAYPSPATDLGRFLWFGCVIGDYALPALSNRGSCIVNVESSQKIDQKKAAGKNKEKHTQQGLKATMIKVTLEGTDRDGMWELTEDMLTAIDPNGPATGGPFVFSHPDANRRGVKWVMVEKVGTVAWQGLKFTVTIELFEWEEPKRVATGGATKTATKAKDWHNAPIHGVSIGSNHNVVGGLLTTGSIGAGSPPSGGPSAKKNPYADGGTNTPSAKP